MADGPVPEIVNDEAAMLRFFRARKMDWKKATEMHKNSLVRCLVDVSHFTFVRR
jgi:hypothetical protein